MDDSVYEIKGTHLLIDDIKRFQSEFQQQQNLALFTCLSIHCRNNFVWYKEDEDLLETVDNPPCSYQVLDDIVDLTSFLVHFNNVNSFYCDAIIKNVEVLHLLPNLTNARFQHKFHIHQRTYYSLEWRVSNPETKDIEWKSFQHQVKLAKEYFYTLFENDQDINPKYLEGILGLSNYSPAPWYLYR